VPISLDSQSQAFYFLEAVPEDVDFCYHSIQTCYLWFLMQLAIVENCMYLENSHQMKEDNYATLICVEDLGHWWKLLH